MGHPLAHFEFEAALPIHPAFQPPGWVALPQRKRSPVLFQAQPAGVAMRRCVNLPQAALTST
jgi:hypothetical protein